MKAFILAAGKGQRFEPISNELPKPMAPILNKPILLYIIENLKVYSFDQIKINLHHLPEYIDNYFDDGRSLGVEISYSIEKELKGTGGALQRAPSFFNQPVLVHSGSLLADVDYKKLMDYHLYKKSKLTIVTSVFQNKFSSYSVKSDESGMLKSINFHKEGDLVEKEFPIGIFIVEKEVLDLVKNRNTFHIVPDILEQAIAQGMPVSVYKSPGKIFRIVEPKDLLEVNLSLLNDLAIQNNKMIFCGEKCSIHPSVLSNLKYPVFLGNDVRLKKDIHIESPVIIGSNIKIDTDTLLSNCVILDNTYIGKNLDIKNAIVHQNLFYDLSIDFGLYLNEDFILDKKQVLNIKESAKKFVFRMFDIMLVASGLLFLWPVMLIIAIFIKIDSGGPVIFKSRRMKYPEKVINKKNWYKYQPSEEVVYYKFRTMHNNIGKDNEFLKDSNIYKEGPYFKAQNDPRITRVGKFLRKASLDELPLLINILKGDLALVGIWGLPKAEAEHIQEKGFSEGALNLTDTAKIRFKGKLGLAGYWQSRGRSSLSAEERLIHDSVQSLNNLDDDVLTKNLGEYKKTNTFKGYYSLILNTINSVINKKGSI